MHEDVFAVFLGVIDCFGPTFFPSEMNRFFCVHLSHDVGALTNNHPSPFFFLTLPLNPGKGGTSENSSVDPGKAPGPAVHPGLLHPETLWEGSLYWTLSIRGSVSGAPRRDHRNQHREAMGEM